MENLQSQIPADVLDAAYNVLLGEINRAVHYCKCMYNGEYDYDGQLEKWNPFEIGADLADAMRQFKAPLRHSKIMMDEHRHNELTSIVDDHITKLWADHKEWCEKMYQELRQKRWSQETAEYALEGLSIPTSPYFND